METIYNGFEDWKDVARQFNDVYGWHDEDKKQAAYLATPEPEKVLVASYTNECYSGSAWIVYYDKGKYYEVSGGHCSCHGLEGQFDPEEYDSAELFLAVLEKRKPYEHKEYHQEIINYLQSVVQKDKEHIKIIEENIK